MGDTGRISTSTDVFFLYKYCIIIHGNTVIFSKAAREARCGAVPALKQFRGAHWVDKSTLECSVRSCVLFRTKACHETCQIFTMMEDFFAMFYNHNTYLTCGCSRYGHSQQQDQTPSQGLVGPNQR